MNTTMATTLAAIEPGPAFGQGTAIGFTGFCAIVLVWSSVVWGWWRVLIVALAATPFGILATLALQGFGILAAFGDLVGQASAGVSP